MASESLLGRLTRSTLIAIAAILVVASLAAAEPPADAIVHLRVYAWEPYLERAVDSPPGKIPFTNVWVSGKYYPNRDDVDSGSRSAVEQGRIAKQQIELAREKLGVQATGGYVLHPFDWLDREHWKRRAEALEAFILASGTTATIALDIEGYGRPTDSGLDRIPPPGEGDWSKLISAVAPVRHVLLKHRLQATIYPAGGKHFGDYTRAALALGATKFGDEYTFVISRKLRDGVTISKDEWRTWGDYVHTSDPEGIGVPRIPATYVSVIRDARNVAILSKLFGVKECWLFIDDKEWLK